MVRFLFRFVGFWFLAAAIVLAVVDGSKSIAASGLVMTPLGEIWFKLWPASLQMTEFGIQNNLGLPWLWDFITQWILTAPGWLVFALLALVFLIIGRRRKRAIFFDEMA